jgi:methionine aminopeptidase
VSVLATRRSITSCQPPVVRRQLGVHIDGFCAMAAHTAIVSSDESRPVAGPVADVLAAAYSAAQIAVRLVKPGHKNTEVTEAIKRVADAYGVTPLVGVLSHNLKRFVVDGAFQVLRPGLSMA